MKKKLLAMAVAVLSMTALVACTKAEPTDPVVSVDAAEVPGYYVNEYSEEFDGEVVTVSQSVTLFDDNTCMLSLQDNLEGTWSDGKITMADGTEYPFTVVGDVLSLDMDGVTVDFTRFVEDQFGDVIPEEEGVQSAIGAALSSYDSVIAGLSEGQYYGFAAAGETCDLLLVTDGVFDNGDGTMAAIDATVYGIDAEGNVIELGSVSSAGTAYPIAVVDDCLISGSNHTMMMEYYSANGSMMTKLYASENFDDEGNATYSVFDLDAEYEGPVDDDSRLMEMFDKYSQASVINFIPAN